jgi:hypothetical protein
MVWNNYLAEWVAAAQNNMTALLSLETEARALKGFDTFTP